MTRLHRIEQFRKLEVGQWILMKSTVVGKAYIIRITRVFPTGQFTFTGRVYMLMRDNQILERPYMCNHNYQPPNGALHEVGRLWFSLINH